MMKRVCTMQELNLLILPNNGVDEVDNKSGYCKWTEAVMKAGLVSYFILKTLR